MSRFSSGMSDELSTALGKVEGLRVLARSGVVSFRGKDVSPQEIGRQLHALYVLDGRRSDRRNPATGQAPSSST